MPVSAAEAIGPAFSHMARICFKPFDIKKWFIMGFCAFLATCGEGGANLRIPDTSSGSGGPGPTPTDISNFIHEYLGLLIAAVILLFILGIALNLFLMWLRARGRFMLLDNIILNRPAVSEPWTRLATQANSYFKFCIVMMLCGIGLVVVCTVAGLLIAIPDLSSGHFSGFSVAAIIFSLCIFVPLFIYIAIVGAFAHDFVLPIMLVRNTTFRPAWEEARAVVVRGHLGSLIIFYLLNFILGIAAAIVGMIAILLTCCIGGLPYLSSVLLLPIIVFQRVYALCYLEQFGPAYRLLREWPPANTGFPIEPDPPQDSPFPMG